MWSRKEATNGWILTIRTSLSYPSIGFWTTLHTCWCMSSTRLRPLRLSDILLWSKRLVFRQYAIDIGAKFRTKTLSCMPANQDPLWRLKSWRTDWESSQKGRLSTLTMWSAFALMKPLQSWDSLASKIAQDVKKFCKCSAIELSASKTHGYSFSQQPRM